MNRLDKEIVERSLAPTRSKAQELIKSGNVKVNNKVELKSSLEVSSDDIIEITDTTTLKYVSRAGLKLEKAVQEFNIDLKNKIVMDIGSSTGGFTDCALQYGASKVIAVDVGTNLMHESLRNNPKVDYIKQLYGYEEVPKIIFQQIHQFVKDYNYTHSGILKSLKYHFLLIKIVKNFTENCKKMTF